jgi:Tol biopolymer transport system component
MRLSLRIGSALTICLFGASTVAPIAVQAMPISAAPTKLLPGGPAAIYVRPSPDEARFSLMSRQIGGRTSVVGDVQTGAGSIVAFPSSSEDGRVVAVVKTAPFADTAGRLLILKDGKVVREIEHSVDVLALPTVSVDGSRVIFPSSARQLASLNVATGAITNLCPKCTFGSVSNGAISPDGRYVAVLEKVNNSETQNVIYDLKTGRVVARRNSGSGIFGMQKPAWSPDSKMIVFVKFSSTSYNVISLSIAGIARPTAFNTTMSQVAGHLFAMTSPVWIKDRFYVAGLEYVNPQSFLSVAYSAATPFDTPQRLGVIGPVRGVFIGQVSSLTVAWSSRQPK